MHCRPSAGIERFGQRVLNNFANLQAAPVAAVLLLIVGAGAGTLGGYRVCASPRSARRGTRPATPVDKGDPGSG